MNPNLINTILLLFLVVLQTLFIGFIISVMMIHDEIDGIRISFLVLAFVLLLVCYKKYVYSLRKYKLDKKHRDIVRRFNYICDNFNTYKENKNFVQNEKYLTDKNNLHLVRQMLEDDFPINYNPDEIEKILNEAFLITDNITTYDIVSVDT